MSHLIYDRLGEAEITGLLGAAAVDIKQGTLVSEPIVRVATKLKINDLAAGVGEFFGGPVTQEIFKHFDTLKGKSNSHYFHMITTHSAHTAHYFCLVREEPNIAICFVVSAQVQTGRTMMEIKRFMGWE